MYSFEDKNAQDKLKDLLNQYTEFKNDHGSSAKASDLVTNAWHLIEWVFEEFQQQLQVSSITDLRETLYPLCPQLKIMHDLANGSKHSIVTRPKAPISGTSKQFGAFSSQFSNDFSKTALLIQMQDGSRLYFDDEIKIVMQFWKDYFKNTLHIQVEE